MTGKTSRSGQAPKAAPTKLAAVPSFPAGWVRSAEAAKRFEHAQEAACKVHERYDAKLKPFVNRLLQPGSKDEARYNDLLAEYHAAVHHVYEEHGFQEALPERIDTPAKLLDLLDRREAGLEMDRAVRKRAGMAPDPEAEDRCYREVRAAAIAGKLNIPDRTGDAAHDLLTLRQWCQRMLHGDVPAARPLTDYQQTVLDLIKTEGPIQGNQIVQRLGGSPNALTAHTIPALKPFGVNNRRGAGYYVDQPNV